MRGHDAKVSIGDTRSSQSSHIHAMSEPGRSSAKIPSSDRSDAGAHARISKREAKVASAKTEAPSETSHNSKTIEAPTPPGMEDLKWSQRTPADCAESKAEANVRPKSKESHESRRPDRPVERSNWSWPPIPGSVIVEPATIVIRRPAPGFVRDPGPSVVGFPDPATGLIGSPIARLLVRRPSVAIARHISPATV